MSGTGKSAALAELEKRGFAIVDTDYGDWSEWSDADGGCVWREDRIAALLAREQGSTLYVSGTVSNQGRFYPQFDAVVLLSAPAEVLLRRIATRTTNDYGKESDDRDRVLRDVIDVEPLLRATCSHEITPRSRSMRWFGSWSRSRGGRKLLGADPSPKGRR
jgi:hypothetical protein